MLLIYGRQPYYHFNHHIISNYFQHKISISNWLPMNCPVDVQRYSIKYLSFISDGKMISLCKYLSGVSWNCCLEESVWPCCVLLGRISCTADIKCMQLQLCQGQNALLIRYTSMLSIFVYDSHKDLFRASRVRTVFCVILCWRIKKLRPRLCFKKKKKS